MNRKGLILLAMLAGSITCSHAQTQVMTLDEIFKLADTNAKSQKHKHPLINDRRSRTSCKNSKERPSSVIGAKATAQYISDCVTFDRDF